VYKVNTDIHLMCELHVTTEQDVGFLMLTHISSQIILREFCLMSLLYHRTKSNETLDIK